MIWFCSENQEIQTTLRFSNGRFFFGARQKRLYENARLSPYATATDCRYLCSFFPSGKKGPKKVLPSCAGATFSRGISANPTLSALEMQCSRTRCTCISQNLAFAPRDKVTAVDFMSSKVVTSAHLRFALRIRISSFSTVGADSISARKRTPFAIRNGYTPHAPPSTPAKKSLASGKNLPCAVEVDALLWYYI